jgi:eukaryotic-like serine/threonine-protein kinase
MLPLDTLLQNRYLVLEQIGKGGMGVVYKATDQRFSSAVALKEIFLDAPHLRKAFEREARLLNHLRHPALPRVSDHFTEEDGQFLVMEFIPGADLWETLKEKRVPFPLASVLDWADQLLDALDYLHTHEPSIIHRDIKPQNLKLTARNHIVLLDFGLAKGTPSQASRVTETGSVFGYSYHYAPLEQMQGTGTDVRSDLYSLGATLYHLMTNVAPPDALSRATAVLNGQADPLRPANEVQAQVSAPVARVLMHAMAQSASQRPATAAAMRSALREASSQSGSASLPSLLESFAGVGAREQTGTRLAARSTEPLTEHQLAGVAALPHDAMTVVQPAVAAGRPQPLRRRSDEHDSVVTRVRATRLPESQLPEPQPRMSGLKISLLASVALLVIAAAIFAFMRPPRATAPSVQAAPSPNDSTPLTTDAAGVQTQTPALSPQSTTATAPSSSQPAVNEPNASPQSNPAADSRSAQPATTDAASQTTAQAQPSTTDAASVPLTPEAERARQAEEIRRQRREQDAEYIKRERDEIDRQREREMQRTAPQPQPPAGFPPPPPPRRNGPPPF